MKTKEEIINKSYNSLIKYLDWDVDCEKEIKEIISKAIAQTREETLKELIREYQDNELDGKGYDFYFSIRAKIDELNKLKK